MKCAQCGKDQPFGGAIDYHALCAACYYATMRLMERMREIMAKRGKHEA